GWNIRALLEEDAEVRRHQDRVVEQDEAPHEPELAVSLAQVVVALAHQELRAGLIEPLAVEEQVRPNGQVVAPRCRADAEVADEALGARGGVLRPGVVGREAVDSGDQRFVVLEEVVALLAEAEATGTLAGDPDRGPVVDLLMEHREPVLEA